MLILHKIKNMNYTAYIGSRDNVFIFNIAPSNEPKPKGGYPSLKFICRVKGIQLEDVKILVSRAEEIMGRTTAENTEIGENRMKSKVK